MQDDVTAAREIVRRYTVVGGYPDTLAIALDAIRQTREQCAAVAMETQYGSFAAAAIRAMGK